MGHSTAHLQQRIVIMLAIIIATVSIILATAPLAAADVWVNGYYRSNGTYVNGHYRSNPDGNPYNNYSFPGNYNPHTGETASGNPDTYLENYYGASGGSGSSYSGYNSYSYPSTPTCPLMSSYNSLSGDCECYSGYVASGDSCVSANSMCWKQIGYMSSYDSLTKTCQCDYGYALDSSGQCKSSNSICSDLMGLMSRYNSSTKKCECMSGYTFNGTSCVYKSSSSAYTASVYSALACPSNSHISPTDATKCLCDTGYQVNYGKDACVAVATGSQTTISGSVDDPKLIAELQAQIKALLAQLAALQAARR